MRLDIIPSYTMAFLLGVLLLAGCSGPARDDSSSVASRHSKSSPAAEEVSKQELTLVLASGQFEQTIEVMNRIKRMQHQGHLLPILVDVWDARFEKYPQVNREFVSSARVRIEVADVLIQAYRNGALDGRDRERDIATYARKQSTSHDLDVARQAILVLGVVNDPVDVVFFTSLVEAEAAGTFGAATVSLSRNCAADQQKVKTVATSLRSGTNRDLLLNAWESNQRLRAAICERLGTNR